jgi:hypothetical protein
MFFMIYPQMCLIILSTLYCKEFHDGSKWLVVDMNVRCDSPDIINSYIFKEMTFAQVQYVAAGCAVIYPIGVPLFFVGVLLWKRDTLFMSAHTDDKAEFERKILCSTRSAGVGDTMEVLSERHNKDELNMAAQTIQKWAKREMFYSMMTEVLRVVKTQSMCGTLYLNYEPQFFWWEALELIRKLILTGVIIFIMPETPTQLAVGCLITLAFMVLYSYAQPYEDIVDDVLQLLCQVAIFTNYFSGLLLMVKSEGATDAGFTQWLVLMNLAPIVFGLGFMGSFILLPLFRGIYDQYQNVRVFLTDTWNSVWIGTHRRWNTLTGRYFPSTRKVKPRFDKNVIAEIVLPTTDEDSWRRLTAIRIEDLDLTLAPIQAEIVAANSDPVAFGGVRSDANENLSVLVDISPIRIEDLDLTLAPLYVAFGGVPGGANENFSVRVDNEAAEVAKGEYPATNEAPHNPTLGPVPSSFIDAPIPPSPINNDSQLSHLESKMANESPICMEDLDSTLSPMQAAEVAKEEYPAANEAPQYTTPGLLSSSFIDAPIPPSSISNNSQLSHLGLFPIRTEDFYSTLSPIQAAKVAKGEYPATNGAPQHPELGVVARSFVGAPALPSPINNYRENVPTLEQGRDEVKATQGAGPKFSNSLRPRSRLSLRSVLPRPSGPLGQRWRTLVNVNGSSDERNKDTSGGTTRGLFVVDI